MHRVAVAALLLVAAVPANAATRSFPAAGFDKVDLVGAGEVVIHTGGGFRIDASGEQAVLDRLDIQARDGTLRIGWRPGQSNQLSKGNKLRIDVSMPRLAGLTLSGAGSITADRAQAADFVATMRGAGQISLPALRAQSVSLTMNGAGEIKTAGTTGRIDAHVNGVGSIDAAGLMAHSGQLDMGGTGSIKAHVDGPAAVRVGGMGSVRVFGKAVCTTHKSGFGSVQCGD